MQREYIYTERAHLMCPNMHFGLLLELPSAFDSAELERALNALAEAHPFLRAVVKYDEDGMRVYYDVGESGMTQVYCRAEGQDIWEDYRLIGLSDWNVFETGLLKVYAYPERAGFKILFVAHHLLCDGRGLMELALEFAEVYATGARPKPAPERLIRDISDLPRLSALAGVSRLLVKRMNRLWRAEGKRLNWEDYSAFSVKFCAQNPAEFVVRDISRADTRQMLEKCRQNDVSVNDMIMAHTYISAQVSKLTIAADIRKNLSEYTQGALGNYATALSVVCKPKRETPIEFAKIVRDQVRARIQNPRKLMLVLACYMLMTDTLIDAAAASALGGFESKPARFVGASMFGFGKRDGVSVTNLGAAQSEYAKSAVFIPPASPAMCLTLGVITLNGEMRICGGRYTTHMSRERAEQIISAPC